MDLKNPSNVLPIDAAPATIMIDRKLAIIAYSMAVAPRVSRKKFFRVSRATSE